MHSLGDSISDCITFDHSLLSICVTNLHSKWIYLRCIIMNIKSYSNITWTLKFISWYCLKQLINFFWRIYSEHLSSKYYRSTKEFIYSFKNVRHHFYNFLRTYFVLTLHIILLELFSLGSNLNSSLQLIFTSYHIAEEYGKSTLTDI